MFRNRNIMQTNLITFAIQSPEKARILENILTREGVFVQIKDVPLSDYHQTGKQRLLVKDSQLLLALNIVESRYLDTDPYEHLKHSDNAPKILVPIDFSEYSMDACRFAFRLAAERNAKVKIMHVYLNPYQPVAFPVVDVFAGSLQQATEGLQSTLERIRHDMSELCKNIDAEINSGQLPFVNFSYMLREGLPEDEILDFAKVYNPELIVMGTKGKSKNEPDIVGSVTAEVMEQSFIPVAVLPENSNLQSIDEAQNIVFFTNFSQRNLEAFDHLMDFVGQNNPKIFLAHIAFDRNEWDDIKIQGFASYLQKSYPHIEMDYAILNGERLTQDIDKFVSANSIDMLAVTTGRRNVFVRLFSASTARKMLYHSHTPMLVLKG